MPTYNITCSIDAQDLTHAVEALAPIAHDLKITTATAPTAPKRRTHKRVGGGKKLADYLHDHFKGRSASLDEVHQFGAREGFAVTSVRNALRELERDGRMLRQGQHLSFLLPKPKEVA